MLAVGAAAEVGADGSALTAGLDWLAGAVMVAAAVRTATADRGASRLALLTAAAWFLATATSDAATGRLSAVLGLTTLAHRALLLHWVVHRAQPGVRRLRIWTGVPVLLGYPLALTGSTVSTWATIGVAGVLALVLALAATRTDIPADGRRPLAAAALSLVALALLWTAGARGVGGARDQVLTLGCLGLVAWLGTQPAEARLRGAVGQLVLDLGPAARQASPVAASLARALADPDLQVRTFHPDTGWTDELGRPYDDPLTAPAGGPVTVVDGVSGGRVALVHGQQGVADTDLGRAAAQAAGLALESVRIEALARREALAVRRSAARLLAVDDIQRRGLADRLRDGPLARLDLLRCSAATHAGPQFTAELGRVIGDLDRLARGLVPSALDEGSSLREALDRMAALAGLPVYCELDDRIDALPPPTATLVYFIAAECLTNVVRHANASSARVAVSPGPPVAVEVVDDGRGGADTGSGRGLRGLADRLATVSGTLRVDSPSGGPTRVRAEIPSA